MNRQELVRKVADKLGIDEAVVDAVYMHQCDSVHENLKEHDMNELFLPELGTIRFKVARAVDYLEPLLRKIDRYKAKMRECETASRYNFLKDRVKQMIDLATIMKYKVSLVSNKYGSLRMKPIEKSLKYCKPRAQELMQKLRAQRQYGFDDPDFKNIPEPEKALAKQKGDTEGLPALPVLPECQGTNDDRQPAADMPEQ